MKRTLCQHFFLAWIKSKVKGMCSCKNHDRFAKGLFTTLVGGGWFKKISLTFLEAPFIDLKYFRAAFCHESYWSTSQKSVYTPYMNPTSCTVFGPLLMELQLHQHGTFDSQSIHDLCIEEDVLCNIFLHPANEWMQTPDLGTLQFYCRGHCSNGMVGLVYIYWKNCGTFFRTHLKQG